MQRSRWITAGSQFPGVVRSNRPGIRPQGICFRDRLHRRLLDECVYDRVKLVEDLGPLSLELMLMVSACQ
jgi:hypothetical protein